MRDRFQPTPQDAAKFLMPPLQEQAEAIRTSSIRWLAGALEAGGTIGIGISRDKRGYVYANPLVALNDTNEAFIASLQHEYGGSHKLHGNSWHWRLSGHKAAEIVAATEPYVVSRIEMALAMKSWLQADAEERIKIAKEMIGFDRYQQEFSAEDYHSQIEDPLFVAGILDNRGLIFPHTNKGHIYLNIDVQTVNEDLLDALQKRYGGSIRLRAAAGSKSNISDRTYEIKRNSYEWHLTGVSARELIQLILPFLRIPPYDGWNNR